MPLQSLVSEPALRRIDKLAEGGHDGARALATYWVGQGVGLMNEAMGAGQVVQAFKEDWIAACERLNGFVGGGEKPLPFRGGVMHISQQLLSRSSPARAEARLWAARRPERKGTSMKSSH